MIKYNLKCPNCGNVTLDSTNKLIFCNVCGCAPNGKETIKCPICNNYNYKMDDGINICNTCRWEFDKSKINECDYRNEWVKKKENYSTITSDIQREIAAYFTTNGITYKSSDFEKAIMELCNYFFKVTLPQKYTVTFSKEIVEKSEYKELVLLFKEKFENGEDIRPWQSRRALDLDYKDILFNHWNIKHLHLIADSKKRSDDTLLYIQDGTSVYFLDVVPHPCRSGWSNFEILRTVCRNHWMKQIGFDKCSDSDPSFVEGSLKPNIIDEKTIRKIYEYHANLGFTIDCISYTRNPLQGVTSSGDNAKIISIYNNICDKISVLLSYDYVRFEPDFNTCLGRIKYKIDGVEFIEQL